MHKMIMQFIRSIEMWLDAAKRGQGETAESKDINRCSQPCIEFQIVKDLAWS